MREVASLAGVGLKTVSRVVNDEPGVTAATRTRVLEAIHRLDYRQDVNASMLRRLGGKTATIGLVLDDVSNPFSSVLHRAVEDAARERRVLVFAGSCDEDPARESEIVASFRARRVDGIIVVPTATDHGYLRAEQQRGTAFVFVDRPARFLDADSVTAANATGAALAVSHLLDHGHERVAFLGDDLSIATAAERLQGYRDAFRARGLEPDESLVQTGMRSADAARVVVATLLAAPRPPTALFTGQNLITIGALRALRDADRRFDVALVGFDDIALADMLEPAVSVVAQDPSAIGRAAAHLLFRRLDGDDSPPEHVIVDVRLIARGSGEIAPPPRS